MSLTLTERLAEAEAALHALNTGTAVVEVRDSTGESVRYSPANAFRLRNYINELKAEIAGTSAARRPMRPIFG